MLAISGRDHPSGSIGDPLTRRDTPNQDDGCIHPAHRRPRSRKGWNPPGEADTRMGRRMQPNGMKDVPIPRSRTSIGPHGRGHAVTRMCPLARRPVAMRPDGHPQAGARRYPFASCGHPWALRVPRKRREGCIARGQGLRPSGRIDSSERGECAPLRGSREAMRPHRRADEPEASSDRRRRPLPSVSSIPSSTGEPYSIATVSSTASDVSPFAPCGAVAAAD